MPRSLNQNLHQHVFSLSPPARETKQISTDDVRAQPSLAAGRGMEQVRGPEGFPASARSGSGHQDVSGAGPAGWRLGVYLKSGSPRGAADPRFMRLH